MLKNVQAYFKSLELFVPALKLFVPALKFFVTEKSDFFLKLFEISKRSCNRGKNIWKHIQVLGQFSFCHQ